LFLRLDLLHTVTALGFKADNFKAARKMAHSCQLFCLGQTLLDMQVTNGEMLLKKSDLKADDGILAEGKHASMYVILLPP
jgi:hypothetical protein